MKLAVIGSGAIVPFHLEALKNVGFEISFIGSRPGSHNTLNLAKKYSAEAINHFTDLKHGTYDAVLIASAANSLLDPLKYFLKQKVPILIEKPVAKSVSEFTDLGDLNNSQVMVGFNRRFYSSVQQLKYLIQNDSPYSFLCVVPENSWNGKLNALERLDYLVSNTVHIFDLIQYLIEPKEMNVFASQLTTKNVLKSIDLMVSADTIQGVIHITFNSPNSYRLEFSGDGYTHVLQPLELLNTFNAIDILEPDDLHPIRRYVPKLSNTNFEIAKKDLEFKPGFLEQATHFAQLVRGEKSEISANLFDAYKAVKVVEQISKKVYGSTR